MLAKQLTFHIVLVFAPYGFELAIDESTQREAMDLSLRINLEDHLFSDPFTMNVVPYKVWSFADAPPTVRF